MTLQEATEKAIERVRLPEWNPQAYVRLDLFQLDNGTWLRGPWLHLYDRAGQCIFGMETPTDIIGVPCPDGAEYVPYEGPLDEADKS